MALFFHVDMDAFYASVEQADNPQWQGRPVIVGAMPGKRGVVAACSYEARTFGVRSAQSSARAYQLCPQAVYVMPDMKRYVEVSRRIMEILGRFTAHLEKLSIDEAWLDLSSHPEALRDPYAYGQKIKQAIKDETSLNITVGIASNRFLAKNL